MILGLAVPSAFAGILNVDQNDGGCSDITGTPYCTIGAAITDAVAFDVVLVAPGTYVENLVIDKSLTLASTAGRDVTTIEGISGVGALGTIVVAGNTSATQIGIGGQGFTIIGIDNGTGIFSNIFSGKTFTGAEPGGLRIRHAVHDPQRAPAARGHGRWGRRRQHLEHDVPAQHGQRNRG